jgi:hypothetical protein
MRGAVRTLPQYAFMAWCSVKAQDELYLLQMMLSFYCTKVIDLRRTQTWTCRQECYSLSVRSISNTLEHPRYNSSVGQVLMAWRRHRNTNIALNPNSLTTMTTAPTSEDDMRN